jgi:hypothetical protein
MVIEKVNPGQSRVELTLHVLLTVCPLNSLSDGICATGQLDVNTVSAYTGIT